MELLVSWLGPMAATTGAALLAFAEKSKQESKRRMFLEMEMRTASVLQREFLPPTNQTHPNYQIEVFYQAAEAVGGDWYSYYLRQNRWLYLHMGDVTGHGASAALLASYVKGAIDALHETVPPVAGEVSALGHIHDEVNGILRKNGSDRLYLTLLSAVIDLESGDIWCLNSAHPSGVLLDQQGKRSHLFSASGSPILGFTDKLDEARIQHRRLHDGDYVILFTDGIYLKEKNFLKARHTKQIVNTIISGWIHSPKELGFFMFQSLKNKHKSDHPLQDDITVLILKYENKPTVVKYFSPAKTA
jgi:serine phosphatase RsbU (regulator of sigma subunit)